MIAAPRYFFRKADKLKSTKTIEQLFKNGKHFSSFPFKVMWLPENIEANLQVAVGVSSRNFKKATDRNRIKRLVRETYRLQKQTLQDQLQANGKRMSVFILYVGKDVPLYEDVYKKMGIILSRLTKFIEGDIKANP